MLANCFSEVKSMSKAVYGYYHYAPATLNILRRAADICRNSDVPGKSPPDALCASGYLSFEAARAQAALTASARRPMRRLSSARQRHVRDQLLINPLRLDDPIGLSASSGIV